MGNLNGILDRHLGLIATADLESGPSLGYWDSAPETPSGSHSATAMELLPRGRAHLNAYAVLQPQSHDDAARAREQSFREYLTDLADGPLSKDQTLTITLARTEYLEIAAA